MLLVNTRALITSVILFLCCSANAQHSELVVRAGPNLSQVRGNDYTNNYYKTLLGFTAGAFVSHSLNSHMALSAGLQYERNGYIMRDLTFVDPLGNNLIKGDVYNKSNYMVLPIMAGYGSGSKMKYSIKAGPFISYLMSRQLIIKWKDDRPDQKSRGQMQHRINFGVGAGAAIAFPLNKMMNVEINLEDHLGLQDISEGGKQHTHAINFTVGLVYLVK